ncbi:P-loop containing nucleoside triphosphate hydrolase protein [Aspergillus cavernicola]|uniref:P-loop containing nucleoside triphosphate hydrolase protein n=1 Tax=Aspergillus cavernicola TaxID=176166 RepID=A0ABR4IJQ7_9EURO
MTLTKSSPSPRIADPALLEKIDKLFAYNIGEYISLPQLVVVGEQSSGKSSVLEGLTKMAFPRDSGLCTRYATQILFRRNLQMADRKIAASIVPGPDTAAERARLLRGWHANDLQALDPQSFTQMMAEVQKLMGLSVTANDGLPAFASDVLRLEIQGPDEEHLSVIDVPGTFENTTPGLTTKEDKAMIDNLVLSYMKNPRSIILAVIPANVDVATQKVDQTARDIDPDGLRTLRVLTKPDLVDKGAEQKVVSLVNGRGSESELGWVLVRNLGHSELQEGTVERDEAEKAFSHRSPWDSVDPQKFGIQALKTRLQELLTSTVRREFLSVRNEVGCKLKDAKNAIRALGGEREEPGQQRTYLLEVVTYFQQITQNALTTNYGTSDDFDRYPELRLATLVVNRESEFGEDMAAYGHEHEFDSEQHSIGLQDENELTEDMSDQLSENCEEQQIIRTRKLTTRPELEDVIPEHIAVTDPVEGKIKSWIKSLYLNSRGFEIGTFSPTLLPVIMKTQSSSWPAIAHGYIADVITMVHKFVLRALKLACPELKVRTRLLTVIMDGLLAKYSRVIKQVDFLLRIERTGRPNTLNKRLTENLQTWREEQNASSLEHVITHCKDRAVQAKGPFKIQSSGSDDVDWIVLELHNTLRSYYTVALDRFVDNVCMQAADFFLVTGEESPMSLFSSSFVSNLTDEQLEEIAGEDAGLTRRRAQLKKKIQDLEMGRKILV